MYGISFSILPHIIISIYFRNEKGIFVFTKLNWKNIDLKKNIDYENKKNTSEIKTKEK